MGSEPPALTLEGRGNDDVVVVESRCFWCSGVRCALRCSVCCAAIPVRKSTGICIVYHTFCFKYFPILTYLLSAALPGSMPAYPRGHGVSSGAEVVVPGSQPEAGAIGRFAVNPAAPAISILRNRGTNPGPPRFSPPVYRDAMDFLSPIHKKISWNHARQVPGQERAFQ